MSRLTIYADDAPGTKLLQTEDADTIAAELGRIGVRFERWQSTVAVSPDDSQDDILAAYQPHLDALMGGKAGSADVIRLTPDHPQAAAMRAKFLEEHIHTEDEVRFFVDGGGNFIMHVNGRIYDARCEAGDLISVPANTRHWFDAGAAPRFTALRIFEDTSGWVPHFTGDDISKRFPAA